MMDGSQDPPADGLPLDPSPAAAPGRVHLLWDNGSGTAAVWRLEPSGSEGLGEADRRLFGPFAGWAARALAVGAGGRVYLLWTGADGAASVWSVDMEAGAARHAEFGPYEGWKARALAVGPDSFLRVLWAGAGGAAALWSLPEEGLGGGEVPESLYCGPFTGWEARALAVGPDNRAHLLWTRGNGAASVWLVGADGRAQPAEYGPYDGWTAVGVAAAGLGGVSRLLWRSAGGYASFWDLQVQRGDIRAPDERPQTVHGPFAGWTPAAVSCGADDTAHLLWRHDSGGLASVWRLHEASGGGHTEYGPYAGWVPVGLALGP